jgi:hypothetical protein
MQFDYSYIKKHKFKEVEVDDSVYYDRHGYPYVIITKQLSHHIFLEWSKDERMIHLVRIDDDHNILGRMPILSKKQLHHTIEFFK